jgi:DNA-binding GntR family transcriptional regulator
MTKALAPETIREGLKKAILDGEYKPGTQLRQDEIAERFGTSRMPVREALRQLEAEGFVTLHPNRGAVVSSLSIEELIEMLEIRIALECRALLLAIPNMIESDFAAALAILEAYDAEQNPKNWTDMNWRFHECLYAPCNRPKLLALVAANYGHVSRFTRLQVTLAAGKERPQREHYAILDAARRGDAKKAAALLEEHIVHTQKALQAAARKIPAGRR